MAPSMELYAFGFNAHNQLAFSTTTTQDDPKDIYTPQKILSGTNIRLLFAGWSTTVVEVDGILLSNRGPVKLPAGILPSDLKSAFGDHTGVLGALTTAGDLLICRDAGEELIFARSQCGSGSQEPGPKIEHLTISGTGKICISPFQSQSTSSNSPLEPPSPLRPLERPSPLLHTYSSLPSLLSSSLPSTTHILPKPPTNLLSSANSFTALLGPTGSIYTWGDPRHQHLGRTPTPSTPAPLPGLVTALDGISIRKVASGGWLTAAVSEDGGLYLWGGWPGFGVDGEKGRIACLPSSLAADRKKNDEENAEREEEEEEVALVDIESGVDVVDVGVGADHILALTADGRVFGVGLNANGQVGIGKGEFCEEWVEVSTGLEEGRKILGVECGYWSSFVLVLVL